MIRLPAFEYLTPRTVGDAVKSLADRGPDAMLVAGGTDLFPNMKRRQFEPKILVGLRGIRELRGVRSSNGGLTIGAGTTLTQVATHAEVARRYPALATAAGLVSSPQLRNMGTLGGNVCVDTRCNYYNQTFEWRRAIGFCMKKDGDICLVAPGSPRCWAVSSSDTAPVLWALGARVRLVGASGERTVPIAALYRDDGIDYLAKQPAEVVTELRLRAAPGTRSAYVKLRRRGSIDFPIAGAAVAVRLDGEEVVGCRVVLSAVASHPLEVPAADEFVKGRRLDAETVREAAEIASRPAKPLDNADLSHYWRKRMVRVVVEQAFERLLTTRN